MSLRGVSPQIDVIPASGGLNLTAAPNAIIPGQLLASTNFVSLQSGGYRRIDGYERYDGTAAPSEATYTTLVLDAVSGANDGDVLTLGTSTYRVLGSDGAELFVYLLPTTAVATGDTVSVNGATYTVQEVTAAGAERPDVAAVIQERAANIRRAAITAPPGTGAVLGVLGAPLGEVVAFRADTSGAVKAYYSSPAGWLPVTMSTQLAFDTGTTKINTGDTITGVTSGATATVEEVLLTSGSFTTTLPASGELVLTAVSGTFSTGENLQVNAVTVAKASGSQRTVSPPATMDLASTIFNFYGGAEKEAVYFIDRASATIYRYYNKTLTSVTTTLPTGVYLTHIMAYKSRLYVTAGASVMISAPGDPFLYDATVGATELAVGAEITNIIAERGSATASALVITTTHSIHILYGNDETDWQLQALSYDIGAIRDTAAAVNGDVIFASDAGIYTVTAVQRYGNFAVNSASQAITPLYNELKPGFIRALTRAADSEYRIYCADGRVLVATQVASITATGNTIKALEFSVMSYKDYDTESFEYHGVTKTIDAAGNERIFMAGAAYVYEGDKGTSFDGAPIFATFITAFVNNRRLSQRKRYKRLVVAAVSEGYSETYLQYDVSPTGYDGAAGLSSILALYPEGTWFDSASWSGFVWSASAIPELRIDTPGTGKAISLGIRSQSSKSNAFVVQSFTLQYTPGRLER